MLKPFHKFSYIVAMFLLLIFPTTLLANKIMPIKRGEVAQYDGFLLDTEGLLRLRNGKKNAEEACTLKIDYEVKKHQNKSEFSVKICEISLKNEQERTKKIDEIQAKEIERLRKIINNSSGRMDLTPLWISVAFVAGAGIAIGIAFAIKPAIEQK